MSGMPATRIDECPYGHPLGPGRVLEGWTFCGCPLAEDGGHRTTSCEACQQAGEQTVRYDPPHIMAVQDWLRQRRRVGMDQDRVRGELSRLPAGSPRHAELLEKLTRLDAAQAHLDKVIERYRERGGVYART